MSLNSDAAGFLIGGKPITPSKDEISTLRRVGEDVRAIRSILEGKGRRAGQGRERAANDEGDRSSGQSRTPKVERTTIATPAGRARANTGTASATKAVQDASRIKSDVSNMAVAAIRRTVAVPDRRAADVKEKPAERDSAGRLVSGATRSEGKEEVGGNKALNLLSDIKDGVSNVVDLSGGDEVDPTIKAAHEIQGIAATALNAAKSVGSIAIPLGRSLFGKGADEKVPWLRRMFTELRGMRREEAAFNKSQLRVLNHIDGKEEAKQGGGGIFGFLLAALAPLMALLTRIPVVGPILSKLAGMLPTFGVGAKLPTTAAAATPAKGAATAAKVGSAQVAGAAEVAGGAASTTASTAAKGGGMLSKAASGVKGVLKRVPLLGAALASVGAGLGAYNSETDDTLTRAEKDKKTGEAVGGGVGTIAGMMAGGAAGAKIGALAGLIGGPVGVAIGTAIGGTIGGAAGAFFGEDAGKVIGETVGGWVTEVRDADIPGKVSTAWTKTTENMSKRWDSGVALFNDGMAKSSALLSEAYTGLSDALRNFGIDLPAAVQATMDAATAIKEKALGLVSKFGDAVKNSAVGRGASWVASKVSDGWNDAKSYLVNASKTAGVDAGVVAKIGKIESGYNSDAAPIRSDGTRMSSAHGYGQFLDGTWTDLVNRHGSKYGIDGAGKLTTDQAAKFRSDKGIQAAMLAEFTKENIDKGRKFGGKDDDANVYAFHNLGDGDAKKLLTGMNAGMSVRDALMQGVTSDKERARVETVISNNKSFYGDGSGKAADAYAKMGDAMRSGDSFANEARALASNSAPVVKTAPVIATAASLPSIKTAPAIPDKIPELPFLSPEDMSFSMSVGAAPQASQIPNVVVNGPKQMAGRDLNSRSIAHVATGGMSGSGG